MDRNGPQSVRPTTIVDGLSSTVSNLEDQAAELVSEVLRLAGSYPNPERNAEVGKKDQPEEDNIVNRLNSYDSRISRATQKIIAAIAHLRTQL